MKRLKSIRNESGQGMTEYLVIVALMAVSAIGIMRVVSNSMKVGFGGVAKALQGQRYNREADEVNENQVKGNDMGDFTSEVNNDN